MTLREAILTIRYEIGTTTRGRFYVTRNGRPLVITRDRVRYFAREVEAYEAARAAMRADIAACTRLGLTPSVHGLEFNAYEARP